MSDGDDLTPFAAHDLIRALEDVAAIRGFRAGLQQTIEFTRLHADPSNPVHFEALDALSVWDAFAALVDEVARQRKEARHG